MFAISGSQFGAIDVLSALLVRFGRADLDLWSYVPGQTEIDALRAFVDRGVIGALRLVADASVVSVRRARETGGVAALQAAFNFRTSGWK